MDHTQFIIKCLKPTCGFRFTSNYTNSRLDTCVKCGSPTSIIQYKTAAHSRSRADIPDRHIEILCDNIRSAHNLGSIFRSSESAGIVKLHLCGVTPPPDHPSVKKTALGSENQIKWEQHWDALGLARNLKLTGYHVWALETGSISRSLFDFSSAPPSPLLLIIGNEINGIDFQLLQLCDEQISIPMVGTKESINVSVAAGIAIFFLKFNPFANPYEYNSSFQQLNSL